MRLSLQHLVHPPVIEVSQTCFSKTVVLFVYFPVFVNDMVDCSAENGKAKSTNLAHSV